MRRQLERVWEAVWRRRQGHSEAMRGHVVTCSSGWRKARAVAESAGSSARTIDDLPEPAAPCR